MPLSSDFRNTEQQAYDRAQGLSIDGLIQQPVPYDPLEVVIVNDSLMPEADAELEQQTMEREGKPETPELLDVEELETKLCAVFREGTEAAYALSEDTKRKWETFRSLARGENPWDDPDDPLSQLGIYLPVLAKALEVYQAQMTLELIPDPSEMDFFELKAKLPGQDSVGAALTELLRDKFRVMSPDQCNGFLDMFDMLLRDRSQIGNCIGMFTHEFLSDPMEGDDNDGLVEGPVLQRFDPANVWPWRTDVNSFYETAATIYEPVAPDQIKNFGWQNVDKIIESEELAPVTELDDQAKGAEFVDESTNRQPTMEMYARNIYVGRFPWHMLAKRYGHKYCTPEFKQQVVYTLASKYGVDIDTGAPAWDPQTANDETWWIGEWVGQTLAAMKPYPLDLPLGKSPLIHDKFYPVPGCIWGQGFYDRAANEERLLNFCNRAITTTIGFASNPPAEIFRDLIDEEYSQIHGSHFRMEPGQQIWRKGFTREQLEARCIRPMEYNERAIPLIREHMAALFGQIRTLTGVNEQMEGNSASQTATENANNLQQGLSLTRAKTKLTEHGLLKEIVTRAYVITMQALREIGLPQNVVTSQRNQALQQMTVMPEDAMTLSQIRVVMTGMNSPGNKMGQIDAFKDYLMTWLPLGGVDLIEAQKIHLKLMDFSGSDRLTQQAPQDLVIMWQQALQMYGPQGAMAWAQNFLNPMQQQMIIGFVMGTPPGGPPAAGGEETSDAQPAEGTAGAPMSSPMPGAPPMAGGMGGFGAMQGAA